jgi:pyrroloquinoline-quinone synthase
MLTLRSQLEARIQSKHMLAHSFYTRWQSGELSRNELRGYAKEYYAFEKEFSRFVSSVHSRCEDLSMRQMLLENLVHEEQGTENHQELWLRFAEGMGADRDEVKGHFHSDETQHLLRVFRKYTQSGDPVEGLAALYAYERQQPDVARQKIDGLQRFYDVKEGDETVSFFKAHQVSDVYHAETEINCLERLCDTDEKKEKAFLAASETLDALYEFLSGVERRYSAAA